MRDSVAQACRAALSGDENARKCCLSVSCYTLGRRIVWVSLPKSPPSSLRHSVLHLWASIMDRSFTQACRAAPSSDKKARNCCSSVSCCTLGRRKCTKVLPKRAVLYSRATKSMGFVAEESHSSLRHSALHPRATKMRDSVAQACRAALSGDENARKCHPSVPYFTLGRRKVWVSLPKSPIHPYVILPYTLGRRKCATVLPKRVVLHPRATKKR